MHVETIEQDKPKDDKKWSALALELTSLQKLNQDAITELKKNDKMDKEMFEIHQHTKERIFNVSFMSLLIIFALGGWQIYYLRNYFKQKNLI